MIINTSTNFTPAHHKICFQLFYLSFFSAWGTVWMRFCWPCIDYNYFYSCKTSIHPVPTSTSPAWTVLVYALPYPSCTPFFVRFPLNCHTTTCSFQRAFSFSLRCCATLRSSGSDPASGGTCKIRTCDLYPFRLSDGFHPVPGSACPRLSEVSAPWPLERFV